MLAMFNAYAGWIYSIAMLAGYVRYAARLAKFSRVPGSLYCLWRLADYVANADWQC
jgi:hypothetical protein